jgi:hypothetical protein
MPGIYTHNFIFRRVVENVFKNRNRSHIMRSLEIFFSDKEHVRAGLFGAIGPDIFDFMNVYNRGGIYGNDIAFKLHDSECVSFLDSMAGRVMAQKDSRNEWSSIQRAYLLGYLSHLAADAAIHPFTFYFSGFPSSTSNRERIHYRIANLKFHYNIDNYYLYKSELSAAYNMTIDEMLPVWNTRSKGSVWPQVKVLLLGSLKSSSPGLFARFFPALVDSAIDGDIARVKQLDRIPANIRLCYRMRRTSGERMMKVLDRMCEQPLTYSDFFVRYPAHRAVDFDALNIHQARWQYPATQRGFRYESVPLLIKALVEQITDIWERFEESVFRGEQPAKGTIFALNAYTGEKDALYRDMKIKDVIKLKV